MNFKIASAALLLAALPALAQAPATHTSPLGFTYVIPADWTVVDTSSALPSIREKVEQAASSADEKKGAACAQLALTARYGDPVSVVVVIGLPFDCFGQQMTEADLPNFGTGAAEGIRQSFDVSEQTNASYALGGHSMWIERDKGTLKSNPSVRYNIENVCTILKKGAACWIVMAVDDPALALFERQKVTLDGGAPVALVPPGVFDKK